MAAKDLIVLAADKNAEFALRSALARHASLGIRPIEFEVRVDPGRDGGARTRGPEILNVERRRFTHALLVFDYEGSGSDSSPSTLETALDGRLSVAWNADAKAIVIEPEVDVWMWGADSHIRHVAGWDFGETAREWLESRGFAFTQADKPSRPKEALEEVFRRTGTPRSSAHYGDIASRLSLQRCVDPAFVRLRQSLVQWFGL